ncbi:extracellular solute-binding protein [Eubacterium ventriosum]|jgi:raffinose/stachyose/melibiose transport system substrate-binding protein|nr:ABC transporter substrate-binding protein [Eubacterium ventriosum]MBS5017985.1 ABC transporter substrate-binding protein [Eubacterium ventriosum]MBT9693987.1 extracellular solute-binding protein [Eubacterium ventriosum]MBT9698115.1 extracellular solute-binding protein [Eubacterium ventriosum]UWP34898.1 ABC transporter substrate-binding protein [Eubacterium ventriosum]
MNMRKKLLSVALCATMVAGLLAGCGSSSKSDKASSDSKGSVYWLNFKPEADEALQGIAKTYEKENGVKVKVVTAASGNYNSTLTSEMGKSAAPTLFVVGNQAAVKTWDDYCIDLKDTDVYKELSTDAFNLKDENGKVASMGYCYESYGIIVNKKLLKKAGYEITDIKDFASLKSVAEDIHKRADKLGFDAFTSSGMDDASSWRFTGHLANMPLFYEGRDDGWKEAPAEIKGTYLDNFKNVWDLYINNSKYDKKTLATGGYDAEAEFKKGEAVFYQNGTWEYDALKKSISDDDMQMIPIYCGVEGEEKAGLCSGTENCWAVNAKASKADQKATLEFMKWLVTSKEGTKVMAEQFGAIPYKKAADSGNVFLKNANDLLEAGNYNVDWSFNYTPNVDEWRASLVAAMNKYDAGGSWDDVKTAFVQGWATQYKAANK